MPFPASPNLLPCWLKEPREQRGCFSCQSSAWRRCCSLYQRGKWAQEGWVEQSSSKWEKQREKREGLEAPNQQRGCEQPGGNAGLGIKGERRRKQGRSSRMALNYVPVLLPMNKDLKGGVLHQEPLSSAHPILHGPTVELLGLHAFSRAGMSPQPC